MNLFCKYFLLPTFVILGVSTNPSSASAQSAECTSALSQFAQYTSSATPGNGVFAFEGQSRINRCMTQYIDDTRSDQSKCSEALAYASRVRSLDSNSLLARRVGLNCTSSSSNTTQRPTTIVPDTAPQQPTTRIPDTAPQQPTTRIPDTAPQQPTTRIPDTAATYDK